MAKKKLIIEKPVYTEFDSVDALTDDEKEQRDSNSSRYHATFTPTWRSEIDCGEHDSLEDAQQAIIDVAGEFEADVIPAWHRESPILWLATGHDGQVDTVMTIAKIEQVG